MSPRTLDIPIRHREVFSRVGSLINAHPAEFLRAGRALDVVWSYEAIKRREQAVTDSLLYLDPSDPEDQRLSIARTRHEAAIEAQLEARGHKPGKVVETQEQSRPFVSLYEFMQTYIRECARMRDPFDLRLLPIRRAVMHSKMILLVAWLASDPHAHKRWNGTTDLESTEFEGDNYLGRSWASFLFLEHSKERRDAWTALVEEAYSIVAPTVLPASTFSAQDRADQLQLLRMATSEVVQAPALPAAKGPRVVDLETPSVSEEVAKEGNPEDLATCNEFFQDRSGNWRVTFGGRTETVPDRKGMGMIQVLLRTPGKKVEATKLSPPATDELAQAVSLDPRIHPSEKVQAPPVDDGQELFDEEYRQNVVAEIERLNARGEEAESRGESVEAERLQGEVEVLEGYLRKGTALKGRERRLGSDIGRARQRVRRNIKNAIVAIRRLHPVLAIHLEGCIITPSGASTSYDPNEETLWSLDPPR